MILFDYVQGVTVRPTGIIEPGAVIKSVRFGYKRVVVHPLAGGISPPSRLGRIGRAPGRVRGILWKLPAIGPDNAPFLIEFVKDHHVLRSLYDPACSEVVKNNARKALRITAGHRVVRQCGGNLRHSKGRLMSHECLAAQRREGQLMLRFSIGGILPRACGLHTRAWPCSGLPNAGEIALRGRSGSFALLVSIVDGSRLAGGILGRSSNRQKR